MQNHRALLPALIFFLACGSWAQDITGNVAHNHDGGVTAVQGESWLVHLNRSFNDTSMGKTGHLGPPPREGTETLLRASPTSMRASPRTVTLHGADLYRLNCQGCHGESGAGAPPEINSVIGPVRNTSAAMVKEHFEELGMPVSGPDAVKLAAGAKAGLLKRLHEGGDEMPAFSQLSDAEIRALVAYLQQLAEVPGAQNQQLAVTETPARVGELIVKSTCHTCHSATGARSRPATVAGWSHSSAECAHLTQDAA